MSGFTIRTPHGFVGRSALSAPLLGSLPFAQAYVWGTAADAAVISAAFADAVLCDGSGVPLVRAGGAGNAPGSAAGPTQATTIIAEGRS